jgi:hypothetical protein
LRRNPPLTGVGGANPEESMNTRLAALVAAAFIAGSCTAAIAQGGAGGAGAGGAPAAPKVDSTPGGPSNMKKMRDQRMMGRGSSMTMHKTSHKKHHMKHKKMMHRM